MHHQSFSAQSTLVENNSFTLFCSSYKFLMNCPGALSVDLFLFIPLSLFIICCILNIVLILICYLVPYFKF